MPRSRPTTRTTARGSRAPTARSTRRRPRGATAARDSLVESRRLPEQLRELVLPPLRLPGRAVAARLRARGDEEHAAVLHAPDLAVEDARLRRVALVVGRVDGEQRRLDLLEAGRRIVVARRVP